MALSPPPPLNFGSSAAPAAGLAAVPGRLDQLDGGALSFLVAGTLHSRRASGAVALQFPSLSRPPHLPWQPEQYVQDHDHVRNLPLFLVMDSEQVHLHHQNRSVPSQQFQILLTCTVVHGPMHLLRGSASSTHHILSVMYPCCR